MGLEFFLIGLAVFLLLAVLSSKKVPEQGPQILKQTVTILLFYAGVALTFIGALVAIWA